MANDRPDILLFMSDQHNPMYLGASGFEREAVDTPNLDRFAGDGVRFQSAYTPCPVCVPARTAMLTCAMPSVTGVFTNFGTFPSDRATFLHALVAVGYETVLCGRMHFVGYDQRHGFTKRIAGDFLPSTWAWERHRWGAEELGPFDGTLGSVDRCLTLVGGGNSPVLEYDRHVIARALDYLSGSHEKPQFLVVGTYAPHCTFVAPPELYRKYRGRVRLPVSLEHGTKNDESLYAGREPEDEDTILRIRAAYSGMVENLDAQFGQVERAWRDHLDRMGRAGLAIYTSDHSEMLGERNKFGKVTLYDSSCRVPLIFAGDGVLPGVTLSGAVGLIDIGRTVCELAGAPALPHWEGESLVPAIRDGVDGTDRSVIAESLYTSPGRIVPGRMVRRGKWKLITYHEDEEHDLLFDVEDDPYELTNLIGAAPEVASDLRSTVTSDWRPAEIVRRAHHKRADHGLIMKWGSAMDFDPRSDPDYVPVSAEARNSSVRP
jgi:choline-sulfatase